MNIESIVNTQNKIGTLNINFPGQWFIVDVKVKIHVNGKLHSTHSIKNGFAVSMDEYKSSNGECKAHEDWSARKEEFEARQYTPLPPLFLMYMIGSIGYTLVFFYRKRGEL